MKYLHQLKPADLLPPSRNLLFDRDTGGSVLVSDSSNNPLIPAGRFEVWARVSFTAAKLVIALSSDDDTCEPCIFSAPAGVILIRQPVPSEIVMLAGTLELERMCVAGGELFGRVMYAAESHYIDYFRIRSELRALWKSHNIPMSPVMRGMTEEKANQ